MAMRMPPPPDDHSGKPTRRLKPARAAAPPGNPTVEAFIKDARPVIAQHLGINAQSLVQLRALAKKHGLDQKDFDAVLQQLTAGAPRSPNYDACCRWVAEVLAGTSTKSLLPPAYRKLRDKGMSRFSMPAAEVDHALQRVCSEKGIDIVTEDRAQDILAGQIEHLTDHRGRLDPRARAEADALAAKLGLTPNHVDNILSLAGKRQKQKAKVGHAARTAAVAGGSLVALSLFAWGAWFLFSKMPPDPVAASTEVVDTRSSPSTSPVVLSTAPAGPAWGDEQMMAAIQDAASQVVTYKDPIKQLESANPSARTGAYQLLLLRTPSLAVKEEKLRPVLSKLFARAYALEPSDDNARLIRARLEQWLPDASQKGIPTAAPYYDQVFWAADTAVMALTDPKVATERKDEMATLLTRAVGNRVDTNLPPDRVQENVRRQLTRVFDQNLTDAAAAGRLQVIKLRSELLARSASVLPDDMREQMDVDFTVSALQGAGDAWKPVEPFLKDSLQAKNPTNLLKLVNLYKSTDIDTLRKELGQSLVALAGISVDLDTAEPAEVARKLTEALKNKPSGLVSPGGNRAEKLRTLASRLLRQNAAANQPELALRQTVNLGFAATLACALAQKTGGAARFDELVLAPPLLEQDPGTMMPAPDPNNPPPPLKPNLDSIALQVKLLRSTVYQQRMGAFQQLGALIENGAELPSDLAEVIAAYILTPKNLKPELDGMFDHLPSVLASRAVQVGLADQLAFSRAPIPQAEKVIATLVNQDVKFGTDPQWKTAARKMILRHILATLGGSPVNDKAEEAIRNLYKEQGQLLGMSAPEFMLTGGVAGLLEQLIRHLAATVSRGDLDDAARQTVQRIPHEVQAAQFLGTNDIQRTALLQRIWVRLLAVHVIQQRPDQATAARQIVQQLQESDAQATSVLAQIHAGEAASLRLWMLLI